MSSRAFTTIANRAILAALSLAVVFTSQAHGQARTPVVSGDGERLIVEDSGVGAFLLAVNYEGPADRAWEMWNEGKFAPALIEADFVRARAMGVHALRIFVQAALAREIAAGRWDKLDAVVALAERSDLRLILTLHDYTEWDLGRVADTARAVAQRYRGRKGILAYDLKNEPRFYDLAMSRYAARPPLQQEALIAQYGERFARADIPAYRESEEGQREVPRALDDEQAWIYLNQLALYREMLADAGAWVRERAFRATSVEYLSHPAADKWKPFIAGYDATLRAWLEPQVAAIRSADAAAPITVGHVDAVLASLPANGLLDYHTIHRYPATGTSAARAAVPDRILAAGPSGTAARAG